MNKYIKILAILLLTLGWHSAFAVTAGKAAQNALVPTLFIASFLEKICALVGIGFTFSALLQYRMHRNSPTAVPLSRCIILLLLGLALITVPFLGYYAHVLNNF